MYGHSKLVIGGFYHTESLRKRENLIIPLILYWKFWENWENEKIKVKIAQVT